MFVLTVVLALEMPSVDVVLCKVDSTGACCDRPSQMAFDSVMETRDITDILQAMSVTTLSSLKHVTAGRLELVFSGALRIIKLWAYRRNIYGSKLGYLGGGGWAVLLCWVCQHDCDMIVQKLGDESSSLSLGLSARILARHFFERIFVLWNDHRVMALQGTEESASSRFRTGTMNVMAPRSGNLGQSSTVATTLTTQKELLRAKLLLKNMEQDELEWGAVMEPMKLSGRESSTVLTLCLTMDKSAFLVQQSDRTCEGADSAGWTVKPADVKAFATRATLRLLVELEQQPREDPSKHTTATSISPESLRPWSRPIIKSSGGRTHFWFLIGVSNGVSLHGNPQRHRHHQQVEDELQEEAIMTFGGMVTSDTRDTSISKSSSGSCICDPPIQVRIQCYQARDLCLKLQN